MSTLPAAAATEPTPFEYLVQLSAGYMPASALYFTTKLGIPDLLAHGPQPVSELAGRTGTNEDALYRVLRMLASLGVYNEVGLRHFKLTPVSDQLRSDHPQSVRPLALWMGNPFHLRAYAEVMHSLRTGQTCVERVTGGLPVFEYFEKDKEVATEFNDAMTNLSMVCIPPVLDAYDFSGIRTLVDVAGGHGTVAGLILQRYPEMRAIVYDLPHVISGAPARLAQLGVAERCSTATGDMFKAVPSGDAYIMKHIIHDWDDDRCVTILRNCMAAMTDRKQGRVILIEAVIEPGNARDFGKMIDYEMLVMPGGRERTAGEFEELFKRAGLRLERIVQTAGPLSVVEARPE